MFQDICKIMLTALLSCLMISSVSANIKSIEGVWSDQKHMQIKITVKNNNLHTTIVKLNNAGQKKPIEYSILKGFYYSKKDNHWHGFMRTTGIHSKWYNTDIFTRDNGNVLVTRSYTSIFSHNKKWRLIKS